MTVLFVFNSYQRKKNIKYDKIPRIHTEHRTVPPTRVSTSYIVFVSAYEVHVWHKKLPGIRNSENA